MYEHNIQPVVKMIDKYVKFKKMKNMDISKVVIQRNEIL
jgi:hypothetical protein